MSLKQVASRFTVRLAPFVVTISLVACSSNSNHQAQTPARVFASPEDAGNSILEAAKSGNRSTVLSIFGSDAENVLFSGDAVDDKNTVSTFVKKYDAMHRWRAMQDGSETLIVGADNYPFAIPLRKNAEGKWFFDTAAGKDEVQTRRIGRNELAVIAACRAIADAQEEYFTQPHDGQPARQYASKFISDSGKQNGLYWKSSDGQPVSPLGPLAAFASEEGYKANSDGSTAFHGYYFHMLDAQTDKTPGGAKKYAVNGKWTGGFALVAFPAEYGSSGVMTFLINQDGVLLQKNLGKTSKEIASAMTQFDPDSSWEIVD